MTRSLFLLVLLFTASCAHGDRCQRQAAECINRCGRYEPDQAQPQVVVPEKYGAVPTTRPNNFRSTCESACQRCNDQPQKPQPTPPTITGG